MGGLINTKGTQRLAKLFNNRFNPLSTARNWTNTIGGVQTTLPAASRLFRATSNQARHFGILTTEERFSLELLFQVGVCR